MPSACNSLTELLHDVVTHWLVAGEEPAAITVGSVPGRSKKDA